MRSAPAGWPRCPRSRRHLTQSFILIYRTEEMPPPLWRPGVIQRLIQVWKVLPGGIKFNLLSMDGPTRPLTQPHRPLYLELHSDTVLCLISQSCLTLCNPMDCRPPGSSVHADSPGKNTGGGCQSQIYLHCVCVCVSVSVCVSVCLSVSQAALTSVLNLSEWGWGWDRANLMLGFGHVYSFN